MINLCPLDNQRCGFRYFSLFAVVDTAYHDGTTATALTRLQNEIFFTIFVTGNDFSCSTIRQGAEIQASFEEER
ncbi:MAG: hypothetical protein MJ052_01835 [Sphaerochaetaceae bacterium]|nr:hypothetical protein [Sphaerochaetaceae bacterium]